MDLNEMVDGAADGPWTEERHSSFLNWVEECFVRRILHVGDAASVDLAVSCSDEGWSCSRLRHRDVDGQEDHQPPLNRYLPDSATESTRDAPIAGSRRSKRPQPYSRAHPSPAKEQGKEKSAMTRKRRPLHPRYDALQEQQADNVTHNSEQIVEADGIIPLRTPLATFTES